MKVIRPGKIVVVLRGRYAGCKGIVVKHFDEGTNTRPYPHCMVVGVERTPLKVTKRMSKTKIAHRLSKVKSFMKVMNYQHILPTRYNAEIDLKAHTAQDSYTDVSKRFKERKAINKIFKERVQKGENQWFFSKLRF